MKGLSLKIILVIAALLGSVGSGFASDLPPCPSSGYFHNCFGTYTFASGAKYVGEWKDDKKNGQGTYTWANGEKYVGEYKDDKKNGQGTYIYANGDKYVGEWKDNEKNGFGVYFYFRSDEYSGDRFFGIYKNRIETAGLYVKGNGRAKFIKNWELCDNCITDNAHNVLPVLKRAFVLLDKENRQAIQKNLQKIGMYHSIVDGLWGRGTLNAIAEFSVLRMKTIEFNSSEVSERIINNILAGELSPTLKIEPAPEVQTPTQDDEVISTSSGSGFASDLPPCPSSGYFHNCFGTYTFADGEKYVGEWKDDKKNGQGTYTFADGEKYVGEWKDGKTNGQGVRTFADGDKYVGEERDGKKNGQGTYTFADGEKYVGEWKDDKKNGQGTYTWANGEKYVGEWKDGKTNGQGVRTFADGEKYVGEERDGKKNGQGTYTWANGEKYVGDWRDGKQHGQGTYTFADGEKYVGEWKDDKQHGQGTYTWGPNSEWAGDKYVGEYKDGKFNGQGTYTYANGTVEEGIWRDNEFQYAKKLSPTVPEVQTPTQDDEVISASSGSGFAVSSNGYVITNHHVIDGCEKVVLHIKGKELPVTVVTYDPQNDLALLKGDFNPPIVFPLSNTRPELLQDIYVAGFPFGDKFSTSVKVTKGIVSSLTGLGNNFSNIQIDAALQSGNSGGPILDDFGNVVAVAVAKLDAKYMFEEFGIIPENTNFGIKSSVVRSVLDSNDVESPSANQSEISKSELGKMITSGTYYISCWMTMAQIEKMRTRKVFFSNLD